MMSTLHLFLLLSTTFFFQATKVSSTSQSIVLGLTHATRSTDGFPTRKNLRHRSTKSRYSDIIEPLTEIPDGFIMTLTVGTPPQLVHKLFFDTGSDLVWLPCGKKSFSCKGCRDNTHDLSAIFDPKSSHSLKRESCMSPLCVDLHSVENYYDTCTATGCSLYVIDNHTCIRPCPSFAYTYAYSIVAGQLSSDILDIHNTRNHSNPRFSFGCVSSTIREPIGIVGFGRGPLSLPSQLGFVSQGFSHCFLSFDFSSNPNVSCPLVIGDNATASKEHFEFTPMLNNPKYPYYYYVGLQSVTVGNTTTIQAPVNLREFNSSGDGGLVMDSGTTYTHLPEPLYSQLLLALKSLIKYTRAEDVEGRSWCDLCYNVPIGRNNSQTDGLPTITFNFLNNTSLTLPPGTYFYKMARPRDSTQAQCLMFQEMDDGHGPGGVFGSFQQQNVEVVYDLERERIGFQTTDCASLAKTQGL